MPMIGSPGTPAHNKGVKMIDPIEVAKSNFGSKTGWDDNFKARGIARVAGTKNEWRVPCHGYWNSTAGRVEFADGHENVISVFSRDDAINKRRCPACEEWFVFPEKRKKRKSVQTDGRSVEEKDAEFEDICGTLGLSPRVTKKSDKVVRREKQAQEFDDETKDLLGI